MSRRIGFHLLEAAVFLGLMAVYATLTLAVWELMVGRVVLEVAARGPESPWLVLTQYLPFIAGTGALCFTVLGAYALVAKDLPRTITFWLVSGDPWESARMRDRRVEQKRDAPV